MLEIKRRIAVDFDGTLFGFDYPRIGPIKPGAKEAMQRFRDLGYHIVIYSCRTCKHDPEVFLLPGETLEKHMERFVVLDMIRVLDENQIPYDEVDDASKGKPNAEFFVDDKGIRFSDNWDEISDFIAAFGPV